MISSYSVFPSILACSLPTFFTIWSNQPNRNSGLLNLIGHAAILFFVHCHLADIRLFRCELIQSSLEIVLGGSYIVCFIAEQYRFALFLQYVFYLSLNAPSPQSKAAFWKFPIYGLMHISYYLFRSLMPQMPNMRRRNFLFARCCHAKHTHRPCLTRIRPCDQRSSLGLYIGRCSFSLCQQQTKLLM